MAAADSEISLSADNLRLAVQVIRGIAHRWGRVSHIVGVSNVGITLTGLLLVKSRSTMTKVYAWESHRLPNAK
jgi:hypothetical protein